MFGWFRRNDGFDWHKYVRTTIKLRRDDRRRKFVEAGQAVAGGAKQAGKASVAAGGRIAVGTAGFLGSASQRIGSALASGVAGALAVTRQGLAPVLDILAQPSARLVAAIIALVAAVWLLAPMVASHLQIGSAIPVAIGIAAFLVAVGPWLWANALGPAARGTVRGIEALARLLGWQRIAPATRSFALALAGVIVGSSLVYAAWNRSGSLTTMSFGSLSMFPGAPIEGRAIAVSGDIIRIGDKTIRLAGIEAPERDQTCRRAGSERRAGATWRCGQAAIEALNQTVRGRPLTCTTSGTDATGLTLARCIAGIEDIAAMLVRGGHVFSDGGLLARYGSYEQEARSKKVGLWQGEAERPSDYRAKRWDEAKRKAPTGCPIKGQVSAQGREYFTPWTAGYDRVRIRETRGERWFCSEQEAQSAGFKAAERS